MHPTGPVPHDDARRARRALLHALLWLPALLAVPWFVNQERLAYRAALAQVEARAQRVAMAQGELIQLRLLQQFDQLEFAARAIVGARAPQSLEPRRRELLARFAAEHPELHGLDIRSANGRSIVWSTTPQPARPVLLAQDFMPLRAHPDFLLGQAGFAPRYGTRILAMRYRMVGADGRTLYFLGSPYRIDELLAGRGRGAWSIEVRDLRDGRSLSAAAGPRAAAAPAPPRPHVEEPIAGWPLSVRVGWPRSMVWQLYSRNLPWRFAARSLVLLLFGVGALSIGRLLRSRERLLRRSARLARFRTLQARVNQAIVQASEVPELLQAVCRLAVCEPPITLAWVAPPQSQDQAPPLAAASAADCADPPWPADDPPPAADDAQPWRTRLRSCGPPAASLELRRGGATWALLHLHGPRSAASDPDLQRALRELADDVSNGLDRLDLLRSQAQLQRQHASLLDNSVAGVVMVRHPGATIIEANAAIARIFGMRDPRELPGRRIAEVAPSLSRGPMIAATRAALKHGRATLEALDILRSDGRPACISLSGRRMDADAKGFTDIVWTVVDVTERQRLMQQMERLSQIDALTGLPNRRALEFHLERAIARARRIGTAVAVGLIDLDDFKPVNDRWGHEVGDSLLQQLGERLGHLARASDMIARLGGDEFVLVIEDLDPELLQTQLGILLQRLHQAVESPFDLGSGRSGTVGMSMGLAVAPADGGSADATLRLADAAMYRVKSRKATRAQWWAFAGTDTGDEQAEPPFDPFAGDAISLLQRVQSLFELVEQQFVENFYVELAQRSELAAILSGLDPQGLQRLKNSQAAHLRFLLSPATSAANIQVRARHLGTLHALVGVAASWLSASMQLYRDLLHWHLDATELVARERYRLQRVLDARIQIDLQGQLDAMLEVQNAYNAFLARPLDHAGQDWTAVVRAKLRALGGLPGIQGCALLRPDALGRFQVIACEGPQAQGMAGVLAQPDMQPTLDANSPTGMGLTAQAWRTEKVMTARSYEAQAGLAPWGEAARSLGLRSVAAIPLLRAGQTDSVMVLYGAYPNQFDTEQGRTFLAAVQNRWNLVDDLLRRPAPAVDPRDAALYRQWLYADGMRLYVQPIVDLRDGRIAKVEALARLAGPDGKVLSPDRFLPALREADLDALFRAGLSQGLRWVAAWHARGLPIDISLNLPPSTLLNPGCVQWIDEALQANNVPAAHLVLELLESQEVDEAVRDQAVATLRERGVRLAIDDLGSGFSSLKRLASMPFDIIKVDRGILVEIERDPLKALSLMRTVVQIGRDFEKQVVVEGVESAAIAEAARVLGARFGQGFGIARPMPAAELERWAARHEAERGSRAAASAPQRFASALAALAYHWLYMHELQPHRDHALADCPLTFFLAEHGADAREAVQWHRIVHETPDTDERKAASHRLGSWLVKQVRAAHDTRRMAA